MDKPIHIRTIPHGRQRYDTVGDWQDSTFEYTISVSKFDNEDYEFLVAIHELVEMWLCRKAGISDEAVTKWDVAYEGSEPGADSYAPYYKQHTQATQIEFQLAVI